MKKNYYIAPDIRGVAIESEDMIAASVFNTEDDTQSITISEEQTDVFTSRRGNIWDEE